jgi:Tol biopolymer transport system component
MRTHKLTLILATALVLFAQADVTLQKAIRKETLEGDLKGAIALYEKAVAEAKNDRATAANALIHLAECHQKLGDSEATKIYERVVRDYPDQREHVAGAQARLSSLRQPRSAREGMLSRQVWSGPKVTFGGTITPDGRYLSHTNWDTSELALHDFVTGKDQDVSKKLSQDPKDYPEESAISRDGKRIAAMWYINRENRYHLRLLDLSAGLPATPRTLIKNEDITWIAPYDWSPDGAWIAVQVQRKDHTAQIGLVSAANGDLRVLKSVDWRGATKLLFSPDGKYLAYDLPAGDNTDQRDIFLISTDASTNTTLLEHPADEMVLAWTPDGSHLLFASDRSGSNAIWAVAVDKGKTKDSPVMIRPDIGNSHALGLSRSGTLFLAQRLGGQDIHIATVDFETGRLLGPTQKPIQRFVGKNFQPLFSPDGKYLAYASFRDRSPSTSRPSSGVLVIHSLETGQARDLRPELSQFDRIDWAPDGRSVVVHGEDRKGRNGIFLIDVGTGAISPIALKPGTWAPLLLPDGKTVIYRQDDGHEAAIFSQDLASGVERKILQTNAFAPAVSPDGRQIAMYGTGRKSLVTASVEGGPVRELINLDKIGPRFTGVKLDWTSDGKSVVAQKWVAEGSTQELWRIPVDGGAPVRIELNPPKMSGGFSIHPDGRRIAYTSGNGQHEVWVLENFLSVLQAKL